MREQALRALAADPESVELLAAISSDKTERTAVRELAAMSLKAASPERFADVARDMVLDEDEDEQLRTTALSAIAFTPEAGDAVDDDAFRDDLDRIKGADGLAIAEDLDRPVHRGARSRSHRSDRMPRDVDALITELLARPVTAPSSCARERRTRTGLSTADAERVRAHLLASFETRGIPDDALDIVAEELRTSASPVVLAGAARAVRGLGADAGGRVGGPPAAMRQTASRPRTSSCGGSPASSRRPGCGRCAASCSTFSAGFAKRPRGRPRRALEASADRARPRNAPPGAARGPGRREGDDGRRCSPGATTVLAFFYTRCMNPARCSLTITRLAGLARSEPHGVAPSSR